MKSYIWTFQSPVGSTDRHTDKKYRTEWIRWW